MVLRQEDQEEGTDESPGCPACPQGLGLSDGLSGFDGKAIVSHGAPRMDCRSSARSASGVVLPVYAPAYRGRAKQPGYGLPRIGSLRYRWLHGCALVLMLGCGQVLSEAPVVSAEVIVAVKGTLRSCLKVAGGLKKTEGGEVAAQHVHGCYDQHRPDEGRHPRSKQQQRLRVRIRSAGARHDRQARRHHAQASRWRIAWMRCSRHWTCRPRPSTPRRTPEGLPMIFRCVLEGRLLSPGALNDTSQSPPLRCGCSSGRWRRPSFVCSTPPGFGRKWSAKRLLVFFTPNGTIHDHWRPSGGETDAFPAGSVMESLTPHRDDLLSSTIWTSARATTTRAAWPRCSRRAVTPASTR